MLSAANWLMPLFVLLEIAFFAGLAMLMVLAIKALLIYIRKNK